PLFDLGDDQPLAGGAALVHAEIAVGVKRVLVTEHADLMLPGEHDAALAVLELGCLADKLLGHSVLSSRASSGDARREYAHFLPGMRGIWRGAWPRAAHCSRPTRSGEAVHELADALDPDVHGVAGLEE